MQIIYHQFFKHDRISIVLLQSIRVDGIVIIVLYFFIYKVIKHPNFEENLLRHLFPHFFRQNVVT